MKAQDENRAEAFIARWQGREGGQERANYALFLSELCDVLGVSRPEPASATTEENAYVFERAVKSHGPDGTSSTGRIDLYKRGCFVLEAKQSRLKGGPKEVPGQHDLFGAKEPKFGAKESKARGARTAHRSWDVLMLNARRQAEGYARALPVADGWPPFILVCDVGHVIEVYADFSGQGKNYSQFPDRQSFRVYLEDLRIPAVRERLTAIWVDPMSLDPARASARVTREIAERLAAVSKALERAKHPTDEVAMFLMRCLFTMFAEDVELLPSKSFQRLLERCVADVDKFQPLVGQLWEAMDKGGFAYAIESKVKRFNGEFFKTRDVLPLGREEIGELRSAAAHDWRDVDPSIFGTLLEQALDPDERRRLGAHYTPRAYVERLVVATIIEPLRQEWGNVLSTAERQESEGRRKVAVATVAAFHEKLCRTRILDPACGTGNFLYVSLELLKRLEGEVLEALVDLGGQEALSGLEGHTVDPHQFLGLEVNPRAAAIAELVLWIGHLQLHIRTKGGLPGEPILRVYRNIQVKDAVLEVGPAGSDSKPRTPEWPSAEFIVGNPPFIGGKDIRARLGDDYVKALWAAHPKVNDSADFVMYWWDRAADLLTRKATVLQRFGLVTTNSICQVFQRRVIEQHLTAKKPMSIVMAIPDHPWTKASPDAAAVRIAMTVGEAGKKDGVLREVIREEGLDSDAPTIEFSEQIGTINSDLTVGTDVTACKPLIANEGLCARGVSLHGAGFIVTRSEAAHLGLGKRKGLEKHIREYRNGRDLMARPRDVLAIDLFGLEPEDIRKRFPEVYQHVKLEVKEKIIIKDGKEEKVGRDWNNRQSYRENWWIFGEPRRELRPALVGLTRYIATVETAKHRIFQFLDASVLPDNKLVVFATDAAYHLGVLSSRVHLAWTTANEALLEDRPVYVKSSCFDCFPFPTASETQLRRIAEIAETLDSHRNRVLNEHPRLTLTDIYNVLAVLEGGAHPDSLSAADRHVFDDGQVLLLKECHENLDEAVLGAYGWPKTTTDAEIVAGIVQLNKERTREEAKGQIRWIRPSYQISRLGAVQEKAELDLLGGETRTASSDKAKPSFPTDDVAQTASVMSVLATSLVSLNADTIATTFKQGRRVSAKVQSVLTALARMGFVDTLDGGRTFVLRRAA